MTTKLKELLKTYAKVPKTDEELERGVRLLKAFAKCMFSMQKEILENESSHINPSINQDAGRGIEPSRTK